MKGKYYQAAGQVLYKDPDTGMLVDRKGNIPMSHGDRIRLMHNTKC